MKPNKAAIRAKHKAQRARIRARRQCAAIPIIVQADGQLMVLLVTSRGTSRWVIPKGWTATKLTDAEAAAREAFEEAGVLGQITSDTPLGTYRYQKRLPSGRIVTCEVSVFLLRVTKQLETWPEKGQRRAKWFRPAEAASLVDEPELTAILLNLPVIEPSATLVSATRKEMGQPEGEVR